MTTRIHSAASLLSQAFQSKPLFAEELHVPIGREHRLICEPMGLHFGRTYNDRKAADVSAFLQDLRWAAPLDCLAARVAEQTALPGLAMAVPNHDCTRVWPFSIASSVGLDDQVCRQDATSCATPLIYATQAGHHAWEAQGRCAFSEQAQAKWLHTFKGAIHGTAGF